MLAAVDADAIVDGGGRRNDSGRRKSPLLFDMNPEGRYG